MDDAVQDGEQKPEVKKKFKFKRLSTASAGINRATGQMKDADKALWPRRNNVNFEKSNKKKGPVYMTFKELREKQRIAESSKVGPGSTEYLKPFGSNVNHKMHFGGRPKNYKNIFQTDSNTSVGPGSTEYLKPFGQNVQHKVFFAGKPKKKLT